MKDPSMIAGSPGEILSLAWPIAIGILSYTVMGVIDTALMGQVSTSAQAGVGLASTLIFCCMSFFRGLVTGAQNIVAAADGAKDRARVCQAGSTALYLGALSGLAAMFVCAAIIFLIVPVITHKEPLLEEACFDYFLIRLIDLPISIVGFAAQSALQGLGDTKIRMWAGLVGNAVNVTLDFVFIFGAGPIPAMGASGAALATIAGTLAMTLMYLKRYHTCFGRPQRPQKEILLNAIHLGLPAGTQSLLANIAWGITNAVLARIGSSELAASQVVVNITSLSFLPGIGIAEATSTLVGRAIGAGDRPLCGRTIQSGRNVAITVQGGCGVLFFACATSIASLFSNDIGVLNAAARLLQIAAAFQLFDAIATIHLASLRAAGDMKFCMMISCLGSWGITLPATLLLGAYLQWGAAGAWVGMLAETVMLAAISGWRVKGIAQGRIGRLDLLLGISSRATR